ncbi:cyclin domain-containing protein [Loa loa]|nr:cyclin domain-containing protein [Loa loa]EFO23361.2 cyclin domain-containing protein [Loa loa]
MDDSTNRRKFFAFVIEAGIKLEAKNSTICTAAVLTYRTLRKSGASELCPYTIASACLLLAAKIEEDEIVKTRDVVNVAYSILHPREPALQIDDESWALRTSLSRMEYIVLRLLKFRLAVENPHKYLLHYISSLMHWCPHEFTKFHIGAVSFIILRDAHVDPGWVLSHSPQTIAIVCLAVALRIAKVSIGVRWYSVFYSSMTKSKLRRLEEELVTLVLRR